MGFTEALSDDGSVTGRGAPWRRGLVCGAATAFGGLGHTLPYAIPQSWPNAFVTATVLTVLVVIAELFAIAAIRTRYMASPFWRAVLQVVVGGALVLGAGMLIGSA